MSADHLALDLAVTLRHDGHGGVADALATCAGLTRWVREHAAALAEYGFDAATTHGRLPEEDGTPERLDAPPSRAAVALPVGEPAEDAPTAGYSVPGQPGAGREEFAVAARTGGGASGVGYSVPVQLDPEQEAFVAASRPAGRPPADGRAEPGRPPAGHEEFVAAVTTGVGASGVGCPVLGQPGAGPEEFVAAVTTGGGAPTAGLPVPGQPGAGREEFVAASRPAGRPSADGRAEVGEPPTGHEEFTVGLAALAAVLDVRTAVRALFARAVAPGPPSTADRGRLPDAGTALERLNAASARVPVAPRLSWPAGGEPAAGYAVAGEAPLGDRLAAALARAAVAFLAGPDVARLRACPAPRCVLYFVQAHARQEWCKPSCGNRARVARHHARRRDAAAGAAEPERQ